MLPARLLLATCAALPPLSAAVAQPIGEPVTREGMIIAAAYLSGIELDRTPSGAGLGPAHIHLQADVHAAKGEAHGFAEGAFIPYLTVSYALTRDGAPAYHKNGFLVPMAARDGLHYGNAVDMAGEGVYHLSLIVSPPTSHGVLRHTDKASGVPDWWKPVAASWTFTYPDDSK